MEGNSVYATTWMHLEDTVLNQSQNNTACIQLGQDGRAEGPQALLAFRTNQDHNDLSAQQPPVKKIRNPPENLQLKA